ncbi:MAG: LysE family translocator [Coleofasciculaceae cyanobacterium SM2_1_6]|nr:LysE family translocator [Coleofasciculaceae cyanobacterium SM2_1_6]
MDLYFLGKGIAIGFAVAAPVGPIGILCIRRSLASGWLTGFVSGLGAATADGIYSCIAGFGLTVVGDFLVSQQFLIRLVGGIFLCYLGIKIFLSPVSQEVKEKAAKTGEIKGFIGNYLSTFLLTITNPLTIFAFVVIFAGLNMTQTNNSGNAGLLVFGVFLGSSLWWLTLASIANWFQSKLNNTFLQWVNWIAGMIIITFGVIALGDILKLFYEL